MGRFEKEVRKDNEVPIKTFFFLLVVFFLSLITCIQYDEKKSTERVLTELKESLIQYNMEQYDNELKSTEYSDTKKDELYKRTLYEIWFIEEIFYEKDNFKEISKFFMN